MKKRKANIFFRILFLLFFVYVSLIIAYQSGYYETKMAKKVSITKEAMEKFEEDVRDGEVVDVKDYLVHDDVDYRNSVTKVGNKISGFISDIITKGLEGMVDGLKGLFW